MTQPRRLPLTAFAAALLTLTPGAALAAAFTVSPIQVYLSTKQANAIVTVRNDSDETMRFQLTAVKWDQSATGEMVLTPTTDIVFFPRLLTLARGEERNVRVGIVVPLGATEMTYRLFIEELPPPAVAKAPATSVRMRTRMGVPIFATPTVGRAGGAITGLRVENGRVVMRLENKGTAHLPPETIRVTGQGRNGAPGFDKTINNWYVLAGRVQPLELALTEKECAAVGTVTATVRFSETVNLTETATVTAASCTPAAR